MASISCSRGFPSLFSNLSLRDPKSATRRMHQIRAQSTARRTTKRLRVKPVTSAPKPHPSAATHGARPAPTTTAAVTSITFDPPSSAPTPFHTPSLFLPESDPRRKLHAQTVHAASNPYATSSVAASESGSSSSRPLPPALHLPKDKRYHLTVEDLKEMRELRSKDPAYWTRPRLAAKFGCSEMFVAIGSPAAAVHRSAFWQKQRETMNKTGPKRRKAREDRAKRKELWYADA